VARAQPQAQAVPDGVPVLKGLEDIAAMAVANHAPVLKVHIENDMHLVRLEPGRLEFRPTARAPRTLAGDLQQKLRDWTGVRWAVSISNEVGAPTLAEAKKSHHAARVEAVMQAPLVRAVLDRFPGAEIVAVRDVAPTDEAPASESDD
jgi:DNA polymerase-3 subunit gamma/tau